MLGGRVAWLCADEACRVCIFFPLYLLERRSYPCFVQCKLTQVYGGIRANIPGCGHALTPGTFGYLVEKEPPGAF